MSHKMRVIALVDMDCFYCQVEEKLNPSLQGKPVAVVQYNLWREGGIIASNYLAKEKGVTKGMWMHEAKDLCPKIEFARVAELRGRADLTKYREAGKQVADVLSSFTNLLERASVDEAYLDLTETVKNEMMKGIHNIPVENLKTTHVVGCNTPDFISNISSNEDTDGFCEDDLKLAVGGIIVEKIRAAVFEKTGYRCSAGIAHNKILAKLVCGLHKPNKQTIIPLNAIPQYFSELPLRKIKRLGGKFGKKVAEELNIQYVGDLSKFSNNELAKKFGAKTGQWLFDIARGLDNEPVLPKLISKSISCCKRFPGKNALFKHKDIEHWMSELGLEIAERLEKDQEENNRKAKVMTISFTQEINKNDISNSKTCSLKSYDAKKITEDAFEVIKKACGRPDGSYHIKYLGISVGNFEDIKKIRDIKYFLEKTQVKLKSESSLKNDESKQLENTSSENIEIQQNKSKRINKKIVDAISNDGKNSDLSLSINVQDQHSPDIFEDLVSESEGTSSVDTLSTLNESTRGKQSDVDNSFFAKYFKNFNPKNQCSSSDNCNENNLEKSEVLRVENKSESSFNEVLYQKCEECSENIFVNEISSHMDYHFALKLQKENFVKNKTNNIVDNKQSCKKRKTGTIEAFLENADSDTSFTEICNECNKRIKLTDLESHSDYHAAKKLNKELNFKTTLSDGSLNRIKKIPGNDISRYLKKKSS